MTPSITERIVMCEQGSPEWMQCRTGCMTATRVAAAIAKRKRVKNGETPEEMAVRHDLRFELAAERLTGNMSEHYVSKYMEAGTEKEPLARVEYEVRYGVSVDQVGFVYHPTIKWAGCSPDGLVGNDGLLEIKCPKVETHLEYIVQDVIPDEYMAQMLWQLACCDDRQWNDFVSYCPALPEDLQIFRKRLERTEQVNAVIRGMEAEVQQFLSEVSDLCEQLRQVGK